MLFRSIFVSLITEKERQDLDTVKQQSSKIVDEVSMESFGLSDFKRVVARLYTLVGSLKKSIVGIFKDKSFGNLSANEKESLRTITQFLSDKKFSNLISADIDLTKQIVFIPRQFRGKAMPLSMAFKNFFESFPAKFLEELKEANKVLGTLINEPAERTSTRVKEMISPTLNGLTETFLKTFNDMYDIRYVDVEREFFDVYDSLNDFKAVGLLIEQLTPYAYDDKPNKILDELNALADGMIIFTNLVKSGEIGGINPDVIRQSVVACDKFVESSELYAVTMYRFKELMAAYSYTCEEKFVKPKK